MYQTPLNRSRSDKFNLILDLPIAIKNIVDPVLKDNLKVDSLQFSIFGSPVPQISVPAIDMPFSGQVYKTSSFSRPAYDPLTIKFLIDNGYKNYWLIWNWLNALNNFKTSTSLAHTKGYKHPMRDFSSNFTIFGLDEFDNNIISFGYSNCFPTNLSEISYSSQDANEITANVTFVFDQLEVKLLKDVNQVTC